MKLKSRIKNLSQRELVLKKESSTDASLVPQPSPKVVHLPLDIPVLSDKELGYMEHIHKRLLDILDLALIAGLEPTEARKQISDITHRLLGEEEYPINIATRKLITERVNDEILGLGPIEPLFAEPTIADILVNGPHRVYIERFGKLEAVPIRFRDDAHLMKIIDRIVTRVGRRIDESSPLVDARLQDGSRVNAIIPPLALDGPVLSIRRFNVDRMKMPDLINSASIT